MAATRGLVKNKVQGDEVLKLAVKSEGKETGKLATQFLPLLVYCSWDMVKKLCYLNMAVQSHVLKRGLESFR